MVKYTIKERNYMCRQFIKVLNDLRNISKQTKKYNDYLKTIPKQTIKNMKYILINFDKINIDKKINNITSNTVYYVWLMDGFVKKGYDKEKAKEFSIEKYGFYQIYIDMYGKILDDFNIVI